LRFLRPGLSEGLLHLRAGLMQPFPLEPALGEEICAALRQQVKKLGLSIGDEPVWAAASFAEQVDPYSREVSLVGTWQGQMRNGSVIFFPDGRIFAEYQVLLPHPEKEGCYVEAVQVWGLPQQYRGDAVIAEFGK